MSKNKNKKIAKVSVAIRQTKAHNNNKKKRIKDVQITLSKRRSGSIMIESDAACYVKTLKNPFVDGCEGVRIPVMSGSLLSSKTYRAHGTITCMSNATGVYECLLLPSVTLSHIQANGSVSSSNLAAYAANNFCRYAISSSTMNEAGSLYRPVAVGFRLKNLLPFNTVTGRVWVVPIPLTHSAGNVDLLTNVTSGGVLYVSSIYAGIASSTYGTAINLPGAREYSMDELINGIVTMSSRPSTMEAFKFRRVVEVNSGNRNWWSTTVEMDSDFVPVTTATGTIASNSMSLDTTTDMDGMTGFVIYCTGLPVDTNSLEIEYIYHYEVAGPYPGNIANQNQLVPSVRSVQSSSYLSVDSILAKISSIPVQSLLSSEMANSISSAMFRNGASLLGMMIPRNHQLRGSEL